VEAQKGAYLEALSPAKAPLPEPSQAGSDREALLRLVVRALARGTSRGSGSPFLPHVVKFWPV